MNVIFFCRKRLCGKKNFCYYCGKVIPRLALILRLKSDPNYIIYLTKFKQNYYYYKAEEEYKLHENYTMLNELNRYSLDQYKFKDKNFIDGNDGYHYLKFKSKTISKVEMKDYDFDPNNTFYIKTPIDNLYDLKKKLHKKKNGN